VRFADPIWLWGLAALPILLAGAWWSGRRRRAALRRFAGGEAWSARFEGEVSRHRRAVKRVLTHAGLAMLVLALARPQWGARAEAITRVGIDVVIAVDTSLSMSAEDLAPSRLGHVRHAIESLLERLAGNRVGLVQFAGRATQLVPLTVDHAAVNLFLEATDVGSLQAAGTALGPALSVSRAAFGPEDPTLGRRGRAIVLFSDGEDHEGEIDEVLDELERDGVIVFAIGTGSVGGAPIPLRNESGQLSGYKKDREGKVVTTRLEEAMLERIALDTGGRYWRATPAEQEIEQLAQALATLEAGEIGGEVRTRFEERYQIFAGLGLLALLVEACVCERRRESRGATPKRRAA
jgi:Ca-activated chloride channel family protein